MELPVMVQALVELLKPHTGFASDISVDQLAAACQLLGDLSGKKQNVAMIIKNGGVQQLLHIFNTATDAQV